DAASAGGRPGGGGAGAADPMSEEARAMLDGAPSPYHGFFKLTPPSLDRPFWNAVLPLTRIGTILDRVELVPREELVYLINLAVLAQALVLAAIVLLLPLLRRGEDALPARQFLKSAAYFAGLGLGFLFVEIYLIEKSAHYLHDKVTAFGLVLAAMLVFSGLGSLLADRFQTRPARGLALAVAAILAWCMAMFWGLDPLLTATGTAPLPVKALIVAALAVPASIALGMPMSLGLAQFQGQRLSFLPWAWAVNGACSIISTPLANLLAVSIGLKTLLLGAVFLYVVVLFCLPIQRRPA
ncbi:MAG: hypothetical protein JNL07_06230, partial [Rhodospirillales bacterium]|nr:hypothetical protein [Rhodospirillales bacterium]